MECTEPGIIDDEELLAYLAGEQVRPIVVQHLARCQRCSSQLATYRRMEASFHHKLYRFDCPPGHLLGEYQLGMLDAGTATQVEQHVSQCQHCSAEMVALSTFMAQAPLPVSLAAQPAHAVAQNNHHPVQDVQRVWDAARGQAEQGVRRVLASLLPPQPRVAFSREANQQAQAWPCRYVAEDVTVTLQLEQSTNHTGTLQLIGFVTRNGVALAALHDLPVQLTSAAQTVYTQHIDELGNFIFAELAPATYTLELQFPAETIVIDQLDIALQA